MANSRSRQAIIRRRFLISGTVQGVGFRPFVFSQALKQRLSGWVRNSSGGVELELQGSSESISGFEQALMDELPPLAVISGCCKTDIAVCDEKDFQILPSAGGVKNIQIAPDAAICQDCIDDIFDPYNRRFCYPFTTCTNCGPRYSIITGIPYDRPKTTMAGFPLCQKCQAEYDNPADRRFHAQPVACPECGPTIRLIDNASLLIAEMDNAIGRSLNLLKSGYILAIKGIGGYHLAVDACNDNAVRRLRQRKKRDEKPFALMVANLDVARELADFGVLEAKLLASPESPVVIVKKRTDNHIAEEVAPDNLWLGLMLPYTPLHQLLFGAPTKAPLFKALVMTSGNNSDEPISYKDQDAVEQLSGIADYFLTHNRPIHMRSDDSVIRVFQGKPLFYRRARGYAPRQIQLPFSLPPILAVGAELKATVCFAEGNQAFLSQHIGDLQNSATTASFGEIIEHLGNILEIKPELVASDLHPDYQSSIYAEEQYPKRIKRIQHHHAHMASCMAENRLTGDLIGVIFDGTGLGEDGTIWGGEFLVGSYERFERAAHFKTVPLAGGDQAIREPWRVALAYLYQLFGKAAFKLDHPVARKLNDEQHEIFATMLKNGINTPLTSSCGRLFDAVAALLNIRHNVSYDGQAAIELEAIAERSEAFRVYPFQLNGKYNSTCADKQLSAADLIELDFSAMFPVILDDLAKNVPKADIAFIFHATVSAATVETCLKIAERSGVNRIVLSGGVFQNRLLSEMVYNALSKKGLQVFTHRIVPPNDAGLALGQAAIAGWQKRR